MREIKFRAWDDEHKKMFDRVGVEPLRVVLFDHSKEHLMMPPEEIGYIGIDCDELILEQFTGRKDKNGRDVYEGDIWNYIDFTAKIEFVGSMWHLTPLPTSTVRCWVNFSANIQDGIVIGDIHQNPELLEKLT